MNAVLNLDFLHAPSSPGSAECQTKPCEPVRLLCLVTDTVSDECAVFQEW